MAATTLAATLNSPIAELRSAPMERIFVIERDGPWRKILQRLFSSEGYVVDVVPDAACGLERLRQGLPAAVILDLPRPGSSGRDSGNGRRRNLLPVCARQSGLCRASDPKGADVYVFADVTVDFFKTEITRGGEEIS